MALSRSKAFIMLVTPSLVTMHVKAPVTRQHSLPRWQIFAFSSGIETMVSFDGIFRGLLSYILWAYFSSPLKIFILNGCWFCKRKIHANRFCCGFVHSIQADKTKYMQTGSVVVLVMAYRQVKQSIFCGLWPILVVPDVIKDVGYVFSLLLSIKDFGHHVRIIVSSLAVRCQTFATRYCCAQSMVANGIAFLLQCWFRF